LGSKLLSGLVTVPPSMLDGLAAVLRELSRRKAGIKPCRRRSHESIDLPEMSFQARCVMNEPSLLVSPWAALPGLLLVSLAACSGSGGPDPQSATPHDPKAAASTVVICPDGSSYDPARNVCIAASGVGSTQPAPKPPSKEDAEEDAEEEEE
jgi:hypothetical protein